MNHSLLLLLLWIFFYIFSSFKQICASLNVLCAHLEHSFYSHFLSRIHWSFRRLTTPYKRLNRNRRVDTVKIANGFLFVTIIIQNIRHRRHSVRKRRREWQRHKMSFKYAWRNVSQWSKKVSKSQLCAVFAYIIIENSFKWIENNNSNNNWIECRDENSSKLKRNDQQLKSRK